MDTVLTPDEEQLVAHAKLAIVKYNQIRHAHGGIDTLYAFLLSESGIIHSGACYEANLSHATVCGERHAIANMILEESYAAKIKSMVIADPVPEVQEHATPPCGTCRHLIWSHGSRETTVILLQYIQAKNGWTFPSFEKYTAQELYPVPYEPNPHLWDTLAPR